MSLPSFCSWLGLLTFVGATTTVAHAQRTDSLALRMPTLSRVADSAEAARPASHLSAEFDVDRPVRVRYCPEPVYPPALAQYGFAGDVVLVFVVDASGRPEMDDMVVSEASNPGFIPSARRVVSKCRFDPAMKSGRPVRYLVQQAIHFVLGRE